MAPETVKLPEPPRFSVLAPRPMVPFRAKVPESDWRRELPASVVAPLITLVPETFWIAPSLAEVPRLFRVRVLLRLMPFCT